MSDKTYKLIELVGVSEHSIEEAIQNAVAGPIKRSIIWIGLRSLKRAV